MAITRIKNNQITDGTIVASSKLVDSSISAGKLADNLVYGSNLTVTGNLTVQGTSTTLDTVNTLIEDPILLLAKDQTGSPVFDIGFVGERGDSTNIAWIWDESESEFAAGFTSADASGNVVALSSYADAQVADLTLVNMAPSGNVTTALNVDATIEAGTSIEAPTLTDGTMSINSGAITGGVTADFSGNVDSGNVNTTLVDATTLTASGTVTGDTLTDGTASINAGTLTGGVAATFSGNVTAGNLITGGALEAQALTAVGNVTGGNIVSQADVTTVSVTASGTIEGDTLTDGTASITSGTLTGGVAATFSGNVDSGNVNTTRVNATTVDASGTITGDTLTDGTATLTGGSITGGVTATFSGNVDSGNVNTTLVDATTLTASGTVTGGTLTDGTLSSTAGTITGGVAATFSGNVDSGNVNTTGVFADAGTFGNITVNTDSIDSAGETITLNTDSQDVDVHIENAAGSAYVLADAGTSTVAIGENATQTAGATLKVTGTESMMIPVGSTAQRPGTPATGMIRFNTSLDQFEFYDNDSWATAGVEFTVIASETFSGDDSTVAFTLQSTQTTASVIVSINGVVQLPTTAYGVSGTTLTFTEAPATGDTIEVREITTTTSIVSLSNGDATAIVEALSGVPTVEVTGNLLPAANVAQNLGSDTKRWNELFLAGSTITLGNVVIKNTGGNAIGFFGPDGTTPGVIDDAVEIAGDSIQSGSSLVDFAGANGNVNITAGGVASMIATTDGANVTGNLTASGNIAATSFIGDGSQLTGIDATQIQNGTTSVATANDGDVTITRGGTLSATFTAAGMTGDVVGDVTGSADTLSTARAIALSGAVTGTANFDGSTGITIATTATSDPTITLAGDLSGSATLTNLGDATLTATVGTLNQNTTGSAAKLTTPRAIALSGSVTGTANFDGSTGITIATTNTADPTLTLAGDLSGSATFTNLGNATLTATIAANSVALGTDTTGNYVGTGATSGSGISGSVSSEGGTFTVTSNATSANTANTIVFRDGSGNFTAGTITATATSAQYADLAEMYAADADIEAGTVVMFGGEGKVAACDSENCRAVAGIISTDPAHLMNSTQEGVALALAGRVPCKVTGPVAAGDLMVSAGNGRAMANNDAAMGTVIGKAIEAHEGGEGVIEVLALMM